MDPQEVLSFWFSEEVKQRWFKSTPELDREIRARFLELWEQAREGQLADWESDPEGALALVIVLDQFPLNMFRGEPEGFATEALAREVAGRAIAQGFDQRLSVQRRAMLYLPFMHSEDAADQQRSVELFSAAGLEEGLKWARHHQEIIRRFGRFPHRNAILGRDSTPQEQAYLAGDDAFRG